MSMSNPTDRVEIITSVQRRRRWTASEKVRMVEETFEPGMTVSLVARRHGVAPNQLFTWRRLVASSVVPAASRSTRLERETPITSATVFIGNHPSAAAAAAAAVFLSRWRAQDPVEHCGGEHSVARERLVPTAECEIGSED